MEAKHRSGTRLPFNKNRIMINKNKKSLLKGTAVLSIAAISAFAAFTAGCESSEFQENVSWNGTAPAAAPATPQEPAAPQSPAPATPAAPAGVGDAVSFGALKWTFGGVNGSGAVQSGVQISGLKLSPNGFSFKYDRDLSAWGFSHNDAGALACFFVQKSTGEWVGGKFDWISSSRTSRDLKHCTGGYGGWSLAGVPNPANAAVVIMSADGKRRSNVLSGVWNR